MHVAAGDTLASVIIELPISYQTAGKNEGTLFRHALTLNKGDGQWKICGGMASVPFSTGTYSFKQRHHAWHHGHDTMENNNVFHGAGSAVVLDLR